MDEQKKAFLRFPVIWMGAEHLVMGYLMRRNILAYKAPPNNEGYDLICIYPDPRQKCTAVRVQVKSRYQSDCDPGFPVKEKSLGQFDYLIVAFLNVGNFYRNRHGGPEGRKDPEFLTLPRDFIETHHDKSSSWQKVRLRGVQGLDGIGTTLALN